MSTPKIGIGAVKKSTPKKEPTASPKSTETPKPEVDITQKKEPTASTKPKKKTRPVPQAKPAAKKRPANVTKHVEPTKRGRGRPKGSTNKAKAGSTKGAGRPAGSTNSSLHSRLLTKVAKTSKALNRLHETFKGVYKAESRNEFKTALDTILTNIERAGLALLPVDLKAFPADYKPTGTVFAKVDKAKLEVGGLVMVGDKTFKVLVLTPGKRGRGNFATVTLEGLGTLPQSAVVPVLTPEAPKAENMTTNVEKAGELGAAITPRASLAEKMKNPPPTALANSAYTTEETYAGDFEPDTEDAVEG